MKAKSTKLAVMLLIFSTSAFSQTGTIVKFELKGIPQNAGSCALGSSWTGWVFPDKFILKTSAGNEVFQADATGIFSKDYRAFTGSGTNLFKTEGSLQIRKIRHTNLGGLQCTWEGTF